ncbi:MAG: hypothetical protein HW412_1063 [Bacteroidetes bacterium]|nr:hypothetical protein [Bacteroidota bacterium]
MRNWLLLLVLLPASLQAQTNIEYSVSNLLRYGTGQERIGTMVQRRDYFENLTETRLTISEFLLGFRLLHDAPPEFGVEFSGIKKRYLEFRKDDLSIRAGNSFTLYGRGLALNLFEHRALGFDSGLDGVKMEYKTRMMKLGFTAGDIHYLDILDLNRSEDYRIRAGSVELTPYPFLSLGVNVVSGKSRFPPPAFPDMYAQFDIPEYYGKLSVCNVDLYTSYAEKRTTVYNDPAGTHRGTAFYGAISYTEESFGVSMEYKDYRFGIADPYDRNNRNRAKKAFAFQNAPIVHKEHTFTLLSRYPHVLDFNDEVGFQMDVFYTLLRQLTGGLNFSISSRHYSFEPTGDTSAIFLPVFGSKARKNSWLPSLRAKYSPFWEVYADVQYYLEEGGADFVLVGFNRRSEDTAEEIRTPANPNGFIDSKRTTAIPISVQYTIADEWTLKFISERQWVYDDINLAQKDYYNHLLSIGIAKSPTFSVTLRYEFTSDFGTVDQRRDWTALDGSFRFSSNHTITLSFGGERGGLVCANGVCRVVNPFLGFRASIISYL